MTRRSARPTRVRSTVSSVSVAVFIVSETFRRPSRVSRKVIIGGFPWNSKAVRHRLRVSYPRVVEVGAGRVVRGRWSVVRGRRFVTFWPLTTHHGPLLSSALAVAASVAFTAALFGDERRRAAFGAQVADAHEHLPIRRAFLLGVQREGFRSFTQVFGQGARQPIRQRKDAVRAETHRAPAADAGQLAHDLRQALAR